MLGQLWASVAGAKIGGCRRIFAVPAGLCLVTMLSGCITADRSDLGIEIPPRVLAAANAVYKDDLLPLEGRALLYDRSIIPSE